MSKNQKFPPLIFEMITWKHSDVFLLNIGDVWISIKTIEYSQKNFNLNNVIIRYCQKFCANTQVKWNGVNQISINSYQTLFKTFIASLIMLVIIIFNRSTKWCSKPPLLGKEPSFFFLYRGIQWRWWSKYCAKSDEETDRRFFKSIRFEWIERVFWILIWKITRKIF